MYTFLENILTATSKNCKKNIKGAQRDINGKNVQEGNLVFYLDKKYPNVRFLILFFILYASYFCGFTHHLNSIVSAICDILYNLLRWSIFFEPFCSFWCFILLYKRACVLFCFLCCPVRAVKTR